MVRGVRAFWYYTVMDFYGNAPLVTEYSATDKTAPTMNTRQEIFDWLIKEVTELTTQAPDPDATNYGYFTKGAAYMDRAFGYILCRIRQQINQNLREACPIDQYAKIFSPIIYQRNVLTDTNLYRTA